MDDLSTLNEDIFLYMVKKYLTKYEDFIALKSTCKKFNRMFNKCIVIVKEKIIEKDPFVTIEKGPQNMTIMGQGGHWDPIIGQRSQTVMSMPPYLRGGKILQRR
jgi:hypothetical protein